MERNFTNENFEGFLRQNAEGLRMRPTDKVWKGISRHLNRRRRRIGIILSFSLLTFSTLGYYLLDNTARQTVKSVPAPVASQTIAPGNKDQTKNVSRNKTDLAINKNVKSRNSVNIPPFNFTVNDLVPSFIPETDNTDNTLIAHNDFTPTIIDSYDNIFPETSTSVEQKQEEATDPLTIESVVNSYRSKRKSKLDWQIYFTPTVSYRKLSENKTYQSTVPLGTAPLSYLYDINSVVTHKPAFGFEFGVATKYPVSKNVKLLAGLQFNVNRYDIKAFSSPTQLATIRLNDRNGSGQVSTVTNYNNFGGYQTNWLENFYFQVSAPVGIEVKLRGDDKMQFGIASTVQPTYVLGDRAYLISSDYKNYAEVPWLIRRWNINTNIETFVAYSTGHLKWQVGPQVRYQLMSSFIKKYPVKEHLFDFGLKVGISLNDQ